MPYVCLGLRVAGKAEGFGRARDTVQKSGQLRVQFTAMRRIRHADPLDLRQVYALRLIREDATGGVLARNSSLRSIHPLELIIPQL